MSKHATPPAQKEAFAKWLTVQLELRQWKAADLARRSKLSVSAISLLLHAQRTPEPTSCQKLASALGLPVDLVYEQAGYLGGEFRTVIQPEALLD
jgi:transcriptional regulator with XRE-family HTH domain